MNAAHNQCQPRIICPHCCGSCNPLPEGSGYCEKCKGTGWTDPVQRIDVTWMHGRYFVSIPSWNGGTVVAASDYDAVCARATRLETMLRDVLDSGALAAMEGCTCETCAPIARARAALQNTGGEK